MTEPTRTLLFICEHGVFRSRVAAALFNSAAPAGWRAVSAGRAPEGELSDNARRVIADSPAATHLEEGAARSVGSFPSPGRIIAIDCDVPGAEHWSLDREDPDGVAEDLRRRVADLIALLLSPLNVDRSSHRSPRTPSTGTTTPPSPVQPTGPRVRPHTEPSDLDRMESGRMNMDLDAT